MEKEPMRVQGVYDDGRITLSVPVRVRRTKFSVEVEIPDTEIEPLVDALATEPEQPVHDEGVAEVLDRIMAGYRGLSPARTPQEDRDEYRRGLEGKYLGR